MVTMGMVQLDQKKKKSLILTVCHCVFIT